MSYEMDAAAQARLHSYFDAIGDILDNDGRRQNFALYAWGLFSMAERKSMEPIATSGCDPREADAAHQRVQHFLTDSLWDDDRVRDHAVRYALGAMTEKTEVVSWVIDDTGFLKQGKHSVGVQRQYTGSAGKITNCQIGVSLTIATPQDHLLVDMDLYLPECWANDRKKRAEAKIPDDVVFRTKPQIALDMIRDAVAADLPRGWLLADEAYGNSSEFRDGVRKLDLDYAVAINSTTKVWVVDAFGRRRGDATSAAELANRHAWRGNFRKITWREGTNEPLCARFAFMPVVPVHDDGHEPSRRERLWLVCEWRYGEPAAAHFYFVTYKRLAFTFIVNIIKERWRTERVYEDAKGELGLDHFEGRRYRGWQHHVSVVIACFAFMVAERARAFPPSARPTWDQSISVAA
jgi:SRSO17 transposase